MTFAVPCTHCGKVFAISEEVAGRKVRCRACGHIQRIPVNQVASKPQLTSDVYPLAPESPQTEAKRTPATEESMRKVNATNVSRAGPTNGHRLVRVGLGEASLLEFESVGLILLSAADLLVTYALLKRGPAFYESNPVAQWFFVRWNVAGMTLFKFTAMGVVVVIGEIVERHRPGWGRGLLLASCLATAAVVVHGLRLLFGHGDNGAPLP